jgi:hypothetical protein
MTTLGWIVVAVSLAFLMFWLAMRAIRWAKQGTKGAALLATIAFPDPDQPPPQQQVEEETKRKKESGLGKPK